jgi:hypothetical protein
MKRMQLVEPLAFEIYALHHGHTDPIPGHPFDRVIERGPGFRVTTGRPGRKAYERQGYTLPTLSRVTKIEKRQLAALIEGIKPLFAADQALFESWTKEEVERFLNDDPVAIHAARTRLPKGWAG